LPPLDGYARKIIHQIAHGLGIKSKSFGKGDGRYIVLIRTSSVRGFNGQAFALAERTVRRQIFNRSDVIRPGGAAPKPKTPNVKVSSMSAGYAGARIRPGETVGEGAPEIGTGKGSAKAKAMMEKMGWSSGQGLGHPDNKGILKPVEAKAHLSRAGLG
jgi:G-patch domain/R3H domain